MLPATSLFHLAATAILVFEARAEIVQYFYNSQQNTCNWGTNSIPANGNTARGGICAYVASINRVYACPAPDPTCWTFGQRCNNNNGTDPGANQIKCDRGTVWCCSNEETCTVTAGQINVCISQFNSPNNNVSAAVAASSQYAVIPSASIGTTAATALPSILAQSTFAVALQGSSVVSSSGASSISSLATTTGTPSGTGSAGSTTSAATDPWAADPVLSGGAIAGIVIGSLLGLGMILGTIIYLVRHKRRIQRPAPAPEAPPTYAPTNQPVAEYPVHEKQSAAISEAPAQTAPQAELPTSKYSTTEKGHLEGRHELQ